MSEVSFMDLWRDIQFRSGLSVRKSKVLAQKYLWELERDKDPYDHLHADPTGEEAVRRVMAFLAREQLAG